MKYKYLKVNGRMIWGENELSRDMLIKVKNRFYDTIINVEEGTYYDADENKWLEIEGTEAE